MSLARRDTPRVLASGLAAAGMRAPALAHASPLLRWAPWLLLVAVVFLLVFVPLGLMPELARQADLGARLEVARTAALQAQQVAAGLSQDAAELPVLREELARAEGWMIGLDELAGMGTTLARHARETGVALLSVGYGPYTRLAPAGNPATGETGGGAAPGGGSASGGAAEAGGVAGAAAPGEAAAPVRAAGAGNAAGAGETSGLPYGQVSVEVTARGSWTNLTRFAGRLDAATPGLRVTSWSVSGESGEGTYQLHVSGLLYLTGLPPVPQAITDGPPGGQEQGGGQGQAAGE